VNFFQRVYEVAKKIPAGKVATYGQLAEILGTRDARRVGQALHANKDLKTPCHRVVNKNGELALNFSAKGRSALGGGGWREQKRRLEAEGVEVVGRRVALKKYQWEVIGNL